METSHLFLPKYNIQCNPLFDLTEPCVTLSNREKTKIGPPYWTEAHIWCCYQESAHPTGQRSIYGAATRNWPTLRDRCQYMVLLPGIGPAYQTEVYICWCCYQELAHPTGQMSIYGSSTWNWPTLLDRGPYIVMVPEIGPPYRTDVNIWIFYQELAHTTRQRSIYVGAATKNRPTLLDRSPYMVLLPGIYIVLYGTHTQ